MSWLPGGVEDPQTVVNTADIATLEAEQTTQDSAISTNASGVSTNATTVFNLGTDVAGHHSRLATIDSDQVTQDSAISANTSAIAAKPETFAGLTDTDVTGVSDQDQLKWDGTAGDWVAFTPVSGPGSNLSWTAGTSTVASDTGTDAVLSAVDATNPGLATPQMLTDISANTAKTGITSGESAKLAHLTVTQAVDLDSIETRVNELDASVVLMGTWDASAGTFPGSGSASSGQSWIVSVAGTVDGVAFVVNDRLLAIVDPASASTYAANWHKLDYTDQVLSVGGLTGAVSDVDVVSGGVAGAGTESVVIGPSASSAGDYSAAVGRSASGAGIASSAYGYSASAGGDYSSAVGRLASAAGAQAVAVGSNSSTAGQQGVAIGYLSNAAGYISVALGRNTSSTGNYDISVGYLSSSTGGQGIAIGRQASTTAANATAVGYLAEATASGAVAIGTSVVAATANTTSVNNLEVQGSLNVVGGFEPADTRTWHTRTLVPDDANRTTMFSNSALTTVTIPLNSAEPFAIGAQFAIHSTGAGGVTLSTTGITINGSSPNTTIAQNEVMVLEKTGTDTWSVYGGTSA